MDKFALVSAFAFLGFSLLFISACTKEKKTIDTDRVKWKQIDAGLYHGVGIKADGSLWAWGDNFYSQMGDGTSTDRSVPTLINSDKDWSSVSCGRTMTFAIKTDGSLWAWGQQNISSTYAGDGNTNHKNTLTQIGSDRDWRSISTGSNHTLAIKNDGSLWSWGINNDGQLGDATNINRLSPTNIASGSRFLKAFAGDAFSVAIKADGTLWTWGSNLYGSLGNGTTVTTGINVPTQISTANDWENITAAWGFVIATKSDGSLWSWGKNGDGQLGLGSSNNVSSPTQIGSATNWVKADAMDHRSTALDNQGKMYYWGAGIANVPELIQHNQKFVAITTGMNFNFAISEDGQLWSWGSNNNGVLGLGSNSGNRTTPTLVGF